MSEPRGKILWRVRAPDGQQRAAAFDALILAADPSAREEIVESMGVLAVH